MLALEAPSVDVARTAVRSLLTDMGVESSLWALPSFTDDGKTFPRRMPLGDLDHMMHHVMSEGETAFASNNDMWTVFDRQINGLAKFFPKKMLVNGLCRNTSTKTRRFQVTAKKHWQRCLIEHVLPIAKTDGTLPSKFCIGYHPENNCCSTWSRGRFQLSTTFHHPKLKR